MYKNEETCKVMTYASYPRLLGVDNSHHAGEFGGRVVGRFRALPETILAPFILELHIRVIIVRHYKAL